MGFKEKQGRENWIKDEAVKECNGCGTRFSFSRRRHHCRRCGGVFCDPCSNYQALVPTGDGGMQGGMKRVCQPCYQILRESQKAATEAAADGGGAAGSARSDLQYIHVAIGKLRQDDATLRRGYQARVQVLFDQLPKLLDEIREAEQRLQSASLFLGTAHDDLVQNLLELCAAYERRRERGIALRRALQLHTLTAFFSTVHTRLLSILLHFVLAASRSEPRARCQLRVLDEEVLLSCREVSTHLMRQWEGASTRFLCEAMEDVAEEAALSLTFRWEEQISCLTPPAARRFGESLVARVGTFLQQDTIAHSKLRLPAAALLAEAAELPQKCTGDRPVELYTRDSERDRDWTDGELLRTAGVKTADGVHYHLAEVRDPYKYYYRLGTEEEALSRGLVPTRQLRNCVLPCFDLERAKEQHQVLIHERGRVLREYVHSPLLLPGEDEDDEPRVLSQALSAIADLLRDPAAYGAALQERAAEASEKLVSIEARLSTLVEHSRDLVEAPEALAEQASYITLQHQLQRQALADFRELLSDEKRRLFYSRLRLKLLTLLCAHRATAQEAMPDFPDVCVAGVPVAQSEEMHYAVEEVIAGDRTGSRSVLTLLDEASHLPPRWLLERWQEHLGALTPAGCFVFADCALARLLHALPRAPVDGELSPRGGVIGTGTLTQAARERLAQRPPPPLGPTLCEQSLQPPLEHTILGQRHVVLPTENAQSNWKEQSLVAKSGIMTPEGHRYHGTGGRRHGKPSKYGWARGSQDEAAAAGLTPFDSQSPPLKEKPSPPRKAGSEQSPTSPTQGPPAGVAPLTLPGSAGGAAAAAAPPPAPAVGVGCEVEAFGLRGATELNGQRGRVCGVEEQGAMAGRLQVLFNDAAYGVRLVKPENLALVPGGVHLPIGSEIEATGLQSLTALNGVRGRVVGVEIHPPLAGRIQVSFPEPHGNHALKVENIVLPNLGSFRAPPSPLRPPLPLQHQFSMGASDGSPGTPLPTGLPSWPGAPQAPKAAVSWPQSTLSCTPRTVTAGAPVNCVLVTRDVNGRATQAGIVAEELRVLVFGDVAASLESEPAPASDDGTTFQWTLSIKRACSLPVAVACRGKCKVSDFVTVVAGPVDFLGRSNVLVWPRACTAGSTMHARIELRDKLSNLATGAGLDDFTVSVLNVVELATTALHKSPDGTFRFDFVPTEEGDVEVRVGFGGLLRQNDGFLCCQAGPVDFKNTLVHLAAFEAAVGDGVDGVLVLRDLYGNRASHARTSDVELWVRAGEQEIAVPLSAVPDEPAEFSFSFQCQRRGLTLLEAEYVRTKERVVAKLSVAMSEADVDWGRSTVSLVPREVQAGHTVTCTVLARDRFGNLLSEVRGTDFQYAVAASPPLSAEPPLGPVTQRGGTISFEFEPTQAGRVWVQVSWRGEPPKCSNEVSVAAAPLSWDLSTVTLPETAAVGDTMPVKVVPRDRYGNPCPMAHKTDFQCAVFNEGARVEHSPLEPLGGGEFLLTFEPRFTGHAYAEVTYSQRTKESARCVVSAGAAHWESSKLRLDRPRVRAGETLRCDVLLLDRYGNETAAGPGVEPSSFTVSVVTGSEGGESRPAGAADVTPIHGTAATSQWWFQFAPREVGSVRGRVLLKGEPKESPPAEVLPGEVWWERCELRFDKERSPAGAALRGEIVTRDRFGNPSDVLRYGEGYAGYKAKMSDFRISARNYAELDHETLEVQPLAADGTGGFAFLLSPRLTGEVRCQAVLLHGVSGGGDAALTASCKIQGGTLDWEKCTLVLNPPEVLAGEKATGILCIKDRFANDASGAQAADFAVAVDNEGSQVAPSPLVLTSESTFRFSAVPTRAGTASAAVTMQQGSARRESNMIYVKPAALDFMSSTLDWMVAATFAGDRLEGVLTFRDRFGNPTQGLPADQVLLQVTNEGKTESAIVVDDYLAAGETSRIRFYCEPTVRGGVSAEAIQLATSERVESARIDVRPGPVDWGRSSTELPSQTPGEQRRSVQVGETVNGVIMCRDRYGNLACPGSESVFAIAVKVGGTLSATVAQAVPARGGGAGGLPSPRSRGIAAEDASVFHFELVPTVAGATEVEVRYNPEPRELAHCCALEVRPAPIDWARQSSVALAEREVAAGETLHFTIHLRDAYGNPTGGAAAAMFETLIDDAGERRHTAPVEGEGSTFSFTAVPTAVGDAMAVVVFQGVQLVSPRCRVVAGPVHWPRCALSLPREQAIACEPFRAALSLRDKYGNPTGLGGVTSADLKWTIRNLGTPDEHDPRPQVVELEPCGPLERGAALDAKASELFLPFEPRVKGTVTVELLCLRADGLRLTAQAPVAGGRPDPRRCSIDISPEVVDAGDTVTVDVTVRDRNRNPTDLDALSVAVTVTNEAGYPKPSNVVEVPGGFKFTFVPTKLGKARARFKHKGAKLELESRQIAVRCASAAAELSSVKVEPLRVVAGRPCKAVINLKDRYKNNLAADPDEAEATAASMQLRVDNGFARVPLQPVKVHTGVFVTDFMPTQRGPALVEVVVPPKREGDPECRLRSNEVDVRPGPMCFASSTVVIDEERGAAGLPLTLIVTTKDQFKNVTDGANASDFTARVFNGSQHFDAPPLVGRDKSSTAFCTQFVPTEVGQCYAEVRCRVAGQGETKKSNLVSITT